MNERGSGLRAESSIDLAVHDPATGRAELLILDFEAIANAEERLSLLRKKLGTYLAYIDSGQYREKFKNVEPEEVIIKVVFKIGPTDDMKAIEAVRAQGQGSTLIVPVRFESESELRARVTTRKAQSNRARWKIW